MSSRLLSMKFMQRAAASTPTSPATPGTPSSERPSKRQRLSTGGASTPATPQSAEAKAVQDVIAADELKRQQIIDRAGAEAGETKWVLSLQQDQRAQHVQTPIKVAMAGYGQIDSGVRPEDVDVDVDVMSEGDDSEDDQMQLTRLRPGLQGRRSFGKFNKAIERQTNPDLSSSSEGEQDSDAQSNSEDDSDEDENDPAAAMIKQQRREAAETLRKERKAKRKSDQAELERLAKERRKREVNLNRTSGGISSGGRGGGGGGGGGMQDMACHKCGQKGHMKKDCPQTKAKAYGQPAFQKAGKRKSCGLDY